MNAQQNNRLIALIHELTEGKERFTLKSHAEVEKRWEEASGKLAKVCCALSLA